MWETKQRLTPQATQEGTANLLLWGRSELFGLPSGQRGGHVERLHHLVVAEALVVLEVGHKVVGEGHHRLDPVPYLAVTQVLKQMAHLQGTERQESSGWHVIMRLNDTSETLKAACALQLPIH